MKISVGDKVRRAFLSSPWLEKCSEHGMDPYSAHKVVDEDLYYDSIRVEGMPNIKWDRSYFVLVVPSSLEEML